MKKLLRKFFKWIFKEQIAELTAITKKADAVLGNVTILERQLRNTIGSLDVSIDVHSNEHYYSPSWAVISLQGEKQDFVKFVNLGASDIRQIAQFLQQFERVKIDAAPNITNTLKFERKKHGKV